MCEPVKKVCNRSLSNRISYCGLSYKAEIVTSIGPVPIHSIKAGDFVLTRDHGFRLVRWCGHLKNLTNGYVDLIARTNLEGARKTIANDKLYQLLFDEQELVLADGHWTASLSVMLEEEYKNQTKNNDKMTIPDTAQFDKLALVTWN